MIGKGRSLDGELITIQVDAQGVVSLGSSPGGITVFSRNYALSPTLGANATFSRASTATYIDSNGDRQTASANTPRFQSGGLLFEGASAENFADNSDNLYR